MNNLDKMIIYLKEAIQFQTANDIHELPRDEFVPYVKRCEGIVPKAAIPYVVLVLLEEEKKSKIYKIRKALGLVK